MAEEDVLIQSNNNSFNLISATFAYLLKMTPAYNVA